MNTLYEMDSDIHKEVDELITKIGDEIHIEVSLRPRRMTRAWFRAIGSLLCTVFGIMDEDGSDKINKNLRHWNGIQMTVPKQQEWK